MKRMGLIIASLGFLLFAQAAQADWTPAKRLTWTAGYSAWPDLAVDFSDHLHVVWYDGTPGNYEIYYKKSTDGGATWSINKRLTFTSGNSWWPAVAVDSSGKLPLVWMDDTPGNYEIYCNKSVDGGVTWSGAKRLTWTLGKSMVPAIAITSNSTIHVVWADDTPGNAEIYYMNGK
jgi:hypothetical protein